MDLGKDKISRLFVKFLLPTITGMIFSSIFVVADGIMVGKGIGANGLAAVNLISPLFTLSTGLGLMFGMGGSVLASEALGLGNRKQAEGYACFTLKISATSSILVLMVLLFFSEGVMRLFGVPEELWEAASHYYYPLIPAIVFNVMLTVGLFFIRLDGSPLYAMVCVAVSAIGNILLDWLFIFPFGWGMFGAAFATALSQTVGFGMMVYYLGNRSHIFRLGAMGHREQESGSKSALAKRILSIGFPAFLGDLSISFMVILGNKVSEHHLGIDGIAAFSVVCFVFPIIFMAYNAIVQSVQPIISYNYRQNTVRTSQALCLSLWAVAVCGLLFSATAWIEGERIVSLFLGKETVAWNLAVKGLGLFGIGFLFFGINILLIGYMQSIGIVRQSIRFTILRGGVLTAAAFILLPSLCGDNGIWLAVPVAEIISFVCIGIYIASQSRLCLSVKE